MMLRHARSRKRVCTHARASILSLLAMFCRFRFLFEPVPLRVECASQVPHHLLRTVRGKGCTARGEAETGVVEEGKRDIDRAAAHTTTKPPRCPGRAW
jgi:hypothetical protein